MFKQVYGIPLNLCSKPNLVHLTDTVYFVESCKKKTNSKHLQTLNLRLVGDLGIAMDNPHFVNSTHRARWAMVSIAMLNYQTDPNSI